MTGRRQVLSGSARVAIASNVVAISALAAGWWDILPSAPLPYAVHKLLHIVGVVVFMGNLIAGPVWLFFAYAEDDPRHFRWAARMLSAADIWLTTPGVQLTLWNGLFLAAQLGGVRQQPWIAESVAWVVVASVLSVLVVLPWQERVVERAGNGDHEGAWRALIGWSVSGTLLMLPFSLVAWMMVSKTTVLW
jgi:uncharacterized membrane protein